MIILGIDPGFAILGYAFIRVKDGKTYALHYGCIETCKEQPHGQRLFQVYQKLNRLVKDYHPDKMAIEEIYFAKNTKTAMKVSEARGVALLVAAQNMLDISEYTPLQVKQALTGYGRASKLQIQKMVKAILKLKKIPKPDDIADALAIALTCCQTKKFSYER